MNQRTRSTGSASLTKLGAMLALASLSAGAAAQSVTVYGVIDTGVHTFTNAGGTGSTMTRMPSLTGSLPSRLGFRGSEDLGNGLKAIFVLEQGFSPDQGTLNQGGRVFGRQAYVGLSGPWGTLSFGRQYSQIFWSMIGDTIGPNIHSVGSLDGYLANARLDNAIAYRGTFNGFTLGATYSLGRDTAGSLPAGGCAGESSTDKRACRDLSLALQYATDGWGLALSGERMNGGAGVGSPLPLSSQTDTRTQLSGFMKFNTVRVGGGYIHRKNEGSPTPTSGHLYAGITYYTGPITLDLQYTQIDFKNSGNDAAGIAARAMYSLSKRTATYVSLGHINNKGAATFTVDGGSLAGSNPAPGVDQTGVMVGLRHSF